MKQNYLGRIRDYRDYLESEMRRYSEIESEESLQGSITANAEKGLVKNLLTKLEDDFPELKK